MNEEKDGDKMSLSKIADDHITSVIMSLHWLPVQYRLQCKLLLSTFKALPCQAPMYLRELVSFYQLKYV
jgi:hypothetical protein